MVDESPCCWNAAIRVDEVGRCATTRNLERASSEVLEWMRTVIARNASRFPHFSLYVQSKKKTFVQPSSKRFFDALQPAVA